MLLSSVNNPLKLRTELPILDNALNGGLTPGVLLEVSGVAGIGKTQLAMSMAVRCALEYPNESVLYVDTERNSSVKRLHQITSAILANRYNDGQSPQQKRNSILKRIRILRAENLAEFCTRLHDLESNIVAWSVKLVIVDSIAALLHRSQDLTFSQRDHQMLKIARDLKYVGDVHQVFTVVTNRASTVDSEFGIFTKPMLGDSWAHCVTTRLVLERHAMCRAIIIVKSPSSDHVVQPFTITERGVEADETHIDGDRAHDEDFDIHDELLGNLDLTGLPTIDPSNTIRSTQQSDLEEHDDERLESTLEVERIQNVFELDDDIVSDSNESNSSEEDR